MTWSFAAAWFSGATATGAASDSWGATLTFSLSWEAMMNQHIAIQGYRGEGQRVVAAVN